MDAVLVYLVLVFSHRNGDGLRAAGREGRVWRDVEALSGQKSGRGKREGQSNSVTRPLKLAMPIQF